MHGTFNEILRRINRTKPKGWEVGGVNWATSGRHIWGAEMVVMARAVGYGWRWRGLMVVDYSW